jgi:hypothetical protein
MSMSVDEGGWERESDSERTPTHSVLFFFFTTRQSGGEKERWEIFPNEKSVVVVLGKKRNDGRFFQIPPPALFGCLDPMI